MDANNYYRMAQEAEELGEYLEYMEHYEMLSIEEALELAESDLLDSHKPEHKSI